MFYMYILANGGEGLFGTSEGSLQPTNFEALTFHADGTGNANGPGYLLCDAAICSKAEANGNSEPFSIPAERLRQIVADYAEDLPAVTTRSFNFQNGQFDFLERRPGEAYPAVISVRIFRETDFSSKLALYSYKPIGSSSASNLRDRAENMIARLHRIADRN